MGDELYLKFLRGLKDGNTLNNTVIIWFSDHGERFGKIRSVRGREEREKERARERERERERENGERGRGRERELERDRERLSEKKRGIERGGRKTAREGFIYKYINILTEIKVKERGKRDRQRERV